MCWNTISSSHWMKCHDWLKWREKCSSSHELRGRARPPCKDSLRPHYETVIDLARRMCEGGFIHVWGSKSDACFDDDAIYVSPVWIFALWCSISTLNQFITKFKLTGQFALHGQNDISTLQGSLSGCWRLQEHFINSTQCYWMTSWQVLVV